METVMRFQAQNSITHPLQKTMNLKPLPIQLIDDIPDCSIKSPLVQLSCPFLSIFLQCCPIDYVVPKEKDQATAQSEKDAEEKKHTIRWQSHRQTHNDPAQHPETPEAQIKCPGIVAKLYMAPRLDDIYVLGVES